MRGRSFRNASNDAQWRSFRNSCAVSGPERKTFRKNACLSGLWSRSVVRWRWRQRPLTTACKRLIRKALKRLEQVVVGFKEPRSRIMKDVVEVVQLFPQECSQQRTEGTVCPGADRASGQSDPTIVLAILTSKLSLRRGK